MLFFSLFRFGVVLPNFMIVFLYPEENLTHKLELTHSPFAFGMHFGKGENHSDVRFLRGRNWALGDWKIYKKTIVSVSLLDPKRIERKFYFDFYLGKFEMGVAEN